MAIAAVGPAGQTATAVFGNTIAIVTTRTINVGETILVAVQASSAFGAVTGIGFSSGAATCREDIARTTELPSVRIWSCDVTTQIPSGATVTITLTTAQGSQRIATLEVFSGLASSPTDKTASNGTGSNVTSGDAGTTAVTTQADDLVYCAFALFDNTMTLSSVATGYTLLTAQVGGSNFYLRPAYKIVAATGTQTATGTFSGATSYSGATATYKGAASGMAVDAASSSGYEPALSSYNWSHTCTGANRGLLVGISIFAAGIVSNITYAGANLTFIRAVTNGVYRTEFWGLAAPALGTNTIAVTLSASLTSIGSAVSYTGVNQTTPFVDSAQAVGTGNPASVVVTPATDNDWIVDAISTSDAAITVGAGQTSRVNNAGALGSGAISDKGPVTPASAQTMQWTGIGALDTWAYLGLAVDPFVDTAVFSPLQGIMEFRGEIITDWAGGAGSRLLLGAGA